MSVPWQNLFLDPSETRIILILCQRALSAFTERAHLRHTELPELVRPKTAKSIWHRTTNITSSFLTVVIPKYYSTAFRYSLPCTCLAWQSLSCLLFQPALFHLLLSHQHKAQPIPQVQQHELITTKHPSRLPTPCNRNFSLCYSQYKKKKNKQPKKEHTLLWNAAYTYKNLMWCFPCPTTRAAESPKPQRLVNFNTPFT